MFASTWFEKFEIMLVEGYTEVPQQWGFTKSQSERSQPMESMFIV